MIDSYLIPTKDIKIFNVDNKEYFFYTPKCQIFEIKEKAFKEYLDICISKTSLSKSILTIDEVKEIFNYFILKKDECNSVIVTASSKIKLTSIVLNIAGECNLSCNYCFAKADGKFLFQNMTTETALKAVDYMIKQNPDETTYSISLFGGEPFLRIKIIEDLLQQITDKYPTKLFNYTVTTNGTVLSKRHINLIKKYHISLLISLDGPESITNKNRPFTNGNKNTFLEIMKTSKTLKENGINFTYRATVIAGENNLIEIAKFFESQEVMYHLVFCFPSSNGNNGAEWDKKTIESLNSDLMNLNIFFLQKIKNK